MCKYIYIYVYIYIYIYVDFGAPCRYAQGLGFRDSCPTGPNRLPQIRGTFIEGYRGDFGFRD